MTTLTEKQSVNHFALKFYKLTKNISNEYDVFRVLDQCFTDLFHKTSLMVYRKEANSPMACIYEYSNNSKSGIYQKEFDRFILNYKREKLKVNTVELDDKLLCFIKVVDEGLVEYYIHILFHQKFPWNEDDSLILEMVVDSLRTKILQSTAMKGLEETLIKFQSIYNSSNFGITICDLNGSYEMANQAFCKMLDYSDKEIKKLNYTEITHLANVEESIDRLQRLKKGEYKKYEIDKTFLKKDKSLVHAHASVCGLYDYNDKLYGIICTIQDVSQEKKYLRSLKESELRYKKIFENNVFPLFVYNINNQYIDANPAFSKLLGYSNKEFNELNLGEIIVSPSIGSLKKHFFALLNEEKDDVSVEIEFKRNNGRIVKTFTSLKSMKSEGGKIDSIIGTIGDISKIQFALDAFERTEQKYNLLFENTKIGVMRMDADFNFIAPNLAICKMLKYSRSELIQLKVTDILFEENHDLAKQNLTTLKSGKIESFVMEGPLFQKDGGKIHGIAHVSGLYENGVLYEILVTLVDITELREAQNLLLESEFKFKHLFNNQAAGIINFGPNWEFITANNTFTKMLGYSIKDLSKKNIKEITHPRFWDQFANAKKLIDKRELDEIFFEKIYLKKDGSHLHALASIKALYNTSKEFLGTIGTIIDIGEQKRAKAEGDISELKYQTLFDKTELGLFIHDNETLTISSINNACLKMFGFENREQIIGKKIDFLFPDTQSSGKKTNVYLKNYIREFISSKNVNLEMDFRRNNGTLFFGKVNSFFMPPDDKLIANIVQDLTTEHIARKAQENMRAKQIQLDAKNRELASYTLFLTQKNNALGQISQDIMDLTKLDNDTIRTQLRKTVNRINNELHKQEDWLSFRVYFENIYPLFFDKLLLRVSSLTHNEQRLCAYIKMKLSNREIANLLYISLKAVETAKYRLKKKLKLGPEISLNEYINKIGEDGASS